MNEFKKICLSCKKYRLIELESGACRLHKKEKGEVYPQKHPEDSCESWINSGQQYDIRLGWIKKTKEGEKVD